MKSAKLLDCTLRDGAYLIDKEFGDDVINGIIEGLVKAGTDIVEIGFLQDNGFGPGKTVFLNSKEAQRFIPKQRGNTFFSVLADCSRYSIENLDEYNGKSFDAVRICFFKHERYEALRYFKAVQKKGYMLFVQPVDILGYTDIELIELIEMVNEIEPYCFSIVDTFGSMYEEDLQRVFYMIDHNLCPATQIGFHSHNNMQMSSGLSQSFLRMALGHRNVVVDATISGMGRGAGNTPTELIAQYMVSKLHCHYDIDALLDLIDNYIDPIRVRATWGYTTEMFLAGAYSTHVNNITYLKDKNSIRSKDIRFILNEIGPIARKRYHYDLLEETYQSLVCSDIDDSESFERLKAAMSNRAVLVLAPGKTATTEIEKVREYIQKNEALVIAINFIPEGITADYLYMNNVKRYEAFRQKTGRLQIKKILTSNVTTQQDDDTSIIAFTRLYKCGWQYSDNSAILLLRLVDALNVKQIGIAGLDGYNPEGSGRNNYAEDSLALPNNSQSSILANREISEMLQDYFATRKLQVSVDFVTTSRFDGGCYD